MDTQAVRTYLLDLQDRITTAADTLDGDTFVTGTWEKPPAECLHGNNRTRILEGGTLLGRGGIGFSYVTDDTLPPLAAANRPELAGRGFGAVDVPLALYPRNPYVSTMHMSMCYLVTTRSDAASVQWFGGGTDLTPYYGLTGSASHFHRICQGASAPYDDELYPHFR